MKDKIVQIILDSMKEINEELDEKQQFQNINKDSKIFGLGQRLDSMGLINFLCLVEEILYDEFEKTITIVNEKAFSRKNSPFSDVQNLAAFIEELLKEE